MGTRFPFAAVVGQEKIKKALLWNLVNPRIGGVLISGEKGTGKSTLVRSICDLPVDKKLVELPLNVTEDRLIGTINLEKAIRQGIREFEPGILKNADGNILYVDEVNLLSDHIVKSLLEAAASGQNIVEREGISVSHPSRFILVGSMNPEEGKLRPQFLDRFGLYVDVEGENDLRIRKEIVNRRIKYESDPEAFVKEYKEETDSLGEQIDQAKERIGQIEVTPNAMNLASSIAGEANCQGHRAELVIIQAACAIAAMDGRTLLNAEDIREAASYALPHRIRDNNSPQEQVSDETMENEEPEESGQEPETLDEERDTESEETQEEEESEQSTELPDLTDENGINPDLPSDSPQKDGGSSQDQLDLPEQVFAVTRWLMENHKTTIRRGSGRRSLVKTDTLQGRYVRYRFPSSGDRFDIALDATMRAAAPHQRAREKNGMALTIRNEDIRMKVREKRTGNTILFVVDASGSMGANRRMAAVKGAVLSLLNDAYQKRDRIGLIAFRNQSADVLLPVTRSVELAQKLLTDLPTGGRTPLAEGLREARAMVKTARMKDKDTLPVIVLISDGRATWSQAGSNPFADAVIEAKAIAGEKIHSVVIDTEQDFIRLNLARKIAEAMEADVFNIEDLHAEGLVAAVNMAVS